MSKHGEKSFGAAFSLARQAGEKEFTWEGKRFHTRLKGEAAPAKAPATAPATASQASLKETAAGRAMQGEAVADPLDLSFGSKLYREGNRLSSAAQSALRGDEAGVAEQYPQLWQAREAYKNVAGELDSSLYGNRTPENEAQADVTRHVRGSREATMQAGILPAAMAGLGHEAGRVFQTGKDVLAGTPFNDVGATGAQLTPGRYVAESAQDLANNLIGQIQAMTMLLGISPLPETPPSDAGVSIDDPNTLMALVGEKLEEITNKLATKFGGKNGKSA